MKFQLKNYYFLTLFKSSQTGLQKAPGLRNLMGTLSRFSPKTGNLLVMNVANDLDVNQKDVVS